MGFEDIDFSACAPTVAAQLIGITVLVGGVGGRIVETEAYDEDDAASHCFGGITTRNAAMFGPPGRLYVYRSYGLHWCMNFVCREQGRGAGVLIRALEPTDGIEVMRQRRGLEDVRLLCAGPGRLTQALAIDSAFNAHPLDAHPLQLRASSGASGLQLLSGPRIGISKAVEQPWRFGEKGSRYLSRSFR
jgi:DNA-3-methyladenine glycosylase